MDLRQREKQIIEAAIECIFRSGVQKTNANLIAKRLGIPSSLVFYYFPNQKKLFDTLIGYIVSVNRSVVFSHIEKKTVKGTFERIQAYIEGNLEWGKKNPAHVAVMMYGLVESSHNPEMREAVVTALQGGEDRVYSLLAVGVAEKEFSLGLGIREMARTIHQSLIGAIIRQYFTGSDQPQVDSQKVMREMTRKLLIPRKGKT